MDNYSLSEKSPTTKKNNCHQDLTLLMYVSKWSDPLQESCSVYCKIFKKVSDHFGALCIKGLRDSNHILKNIFRNRNYVKRKLRSNFKISRPKMTACNFKKSLQHRCFPINLKKTF